LVLQILNSWWLYSFWSRICSNYLSLVSWIYCLYIGLCLLYYLPMQTIWGRSKTTVRWEYFFHCYLLGHVPWSLAPT
jgi:hypothetical protein